MFSGSEELKYTCVKSLPHSLPAILSGIRGFHSTLDSIFAADCANAINRHGHVRHVEQQRRRAANRHIMAGRVQPAVAVRKLGVPTVCHEVLFCATTFCSMIHR